MKISVSRVQKHPREPPTRTGICLKLSFENRDAGACGPGPRFPFFLPFSSLYAPGQYPAATPDTHPKTNTHPTQTAHPAGNPCGRRILMRAPWIIHNFLDYSLLSQLPGPSPRAQGPGPWIIHSYTKFRQFALGSRANFLIWYNYE